MRTRTILSIAAATTLALTGCTTEPIDGGPEGTAEQQPEPFDRTASPTTTEGDESAATPRVEPLDFEGFVEASAQSTDGSVVQVDEAEIRGTDGWVVVHAENENGEPGEVIGKRFLGTDLEVKERTDFELELDQPLGSGEHTVFVMLHIDGGVAGEYEFPGPDEPLVVDGEVVQVAVPVTVE